MWPQLLSVGIAAVPLAAYFTTGRVLRAVFHGRVIMVPGPVYQAGRALGPGRRVAQKFPATARIMARRSR
jgi:hypothetical protein